MAKPTKLLIIWLGATFLLAPLFYGFLPGLPILIVGSGSFQERLTRFAWGGLYLAQFGVLFTVLLGLPYAAAIIVWTRLARTVAVIEKSRFHVAMFTAVLALPTAIVSSIGAAHFASRIRWDLAFEAMPTVFVIIWSALLLPRLLIPALAPGAFSSENSV